MGLNNNSSTTYDFNSIQRNTITMNDQLIINTQPIADTMDIAINGLEKIKFTTKQSESIVSRLIRAEFDGTSHYELTKSQDLINAANDFGLYELADEMKNDL